MGQSPQASGATQVTADDPTVELDVLEQTISMEGGRIVREDAYGLAAGPHPARLDSRRQSGRAQEASRRQQRSVGHARSCGTARPAGSTGFTTRTKSSTCWKAPSSSKMPPERASGCRRATPSCFPRAHSIAGRSPVTFARSPSSTRRCRPRCGSCRGNPQATDRPVPAQAGWRGRLGRLNVRSAWRAGDTPRPGDAR